MILSKWNNLNFKNMTAHLKNLLTVAAFLLIGSSICSCNAQNSSDTFNSQGKTITIYPIKHGSIRITLDTLEIEVDPVTKLKPVTDYSKYPKADIILVTHSHFDYFDPVAIGKLVKRQTVIITNEDAISLTR